MKSRSLEKKNWCKKFKCLKGIIGYNKKNPFLKEKKKE